MFAAVHISSMVMPRSSSSLMKSTGPGLAYHLRVEAATALRTARAMHMPTSVAVPAYFSPSPSGQHTAMASLVVPVPRVLVSIEGGRLGLGDGDERVGHAGLVQRSGPGRR